MEINPFGIPGSLFGMKVIESRDLPRYTLPEEVMPGVTWPPGFREDFNRWAAARLGTINLVPHGTAYAIGGQYMVMRQADVAQIINIFG